MITDEQRLFHSFLEQHDQSSWNEVVSRLLPSIHIVDRDAVPIWFRFFPLALNRALRSAEDPIAVRHKLKLEGIPELELQIDRSHRFLYGHRYWHEVKPALVAHSRAVRPPVTLSLEQTLRDLAQRVSDSHNAALGEVLGITAVAFMIFQQVGPDLFQAAHADVSPLPLHKRRADEVARSRTRGVGGGLLGLILSGRKKYSVRFDENTPESVFEVIEGQDLAMGAATDKRDYRKYDARCTEGPIPVECRSGSCGSCWIGIISGREKLPPMSDFEASRLKFFGYLRERGESHPTIRLACQNSCAGSLTIAIPSWNGVIGKLFPD